MLDYILLGLLREPASGYDLKKIFDRQISHFWAAELSQIYPTLRRLQQRGWVQCSKAASKRGSGRKVYRVTSTGTQALRTWLRGKPEYGDERIAYLAQIFFMGELGDLSQSERFFRGLRDHFAAKLETLRRLERLWSEADLNHPDDLPDDEFHVHLVLRKGLLSLEAHKRWCSESIRRLRARASTTRGPKGMQRIRETSKPSAVERSRRKRGNA
jgi:PadR family transcriptional regulator AphA